MSKALCQLSKSSFTRKIDKANLPWRFMQPMFTMYNGRTDPVEHVSHFSQKMAVYSRNEALMCKVFPSSLGLVTMSVRISALKSYCMMLCMLLCMTLCMT